MFRAGDRIRHRNCLDVDLVVVKVDFVNTEKTKLKVIYINRNGNCIIDPKPDKVTIDKGQYKNWKIVKS